MLKYCKKCGCDTERNASGGCKPCVKATSAAWYASNHERAKATIAAWRDANYERVKAKKAAWRKNNPEAKRLGNHTRRAQKASSGGVLSKGLSGKLYKLQRGKCPCCGKPLGKTYHLDHIMPLSLGGVNADSNIQLLRGICNLKKHAKDPIAWANENGMLL